MKILRFNEVRRITGLSRSSIWRLENEGRFPSRVNLGDHSVGWYQSEIENWLSSRPRGIAPAPSHLHAAA